MTDPDLYEQIINRFITDFDSETAVLQQKLRQALKQHETALRQSFDLIRAEHVVEESEKDPAFRERVEKALMTANERLKEVRAQVERLSLNQRDEA